MLGNVGQPQGILLLGGEVTVNEIVVHRCSDLPFLPRFLPNMLRQLLSEQIRQAVRSAIGSPPVRLPGPDSHRLATTRFQPSQITSSRNPSRITGHTPGFR
jgi:hypothetical protein